MSLSKDDSLIHSLFTKNDEGVASASLEAVAEKLNFNSQDFKKLSCIAVKKIGEKSSLFYIDGDSKRDLRIYLRGPLPDKEETTVYVVSF